jgi:spore coat polysaccharide biosynthesis protein SpsF (cytidylyltransferase family)/sialic acid synthase SpsE
MKNQPYILIELANTHGGDLTYLHDLIRAFDSYQGSFGMKFQPLSPETLATPDFEWYKVYQDLYFTPNQWRETLELAKETKDIWLDLFDAYGVQILRENLPNIHGIKFQSSVLFNTELMELLSSLDLSHCQLIVNIAAQEIEQIKERISYVQETLQPKEIWVEIGFQSYPTELQDSGLSKIHTLRETFTNPIVFADHLDGTSDDALYIPLFALHQGVNVIEKHVMLGDRETKYDHFSSLTPERFALMMEKINAYQQAFTQPFINEREQNYLAKTLMIPVAKNVLNAGDLVHPHSDLFFRRSGKPGLTLPEIQAIQKEFKVLTSDKKPYDTLQTSDFRRAKIGVIVACRMKSSRLKEKAILPIGELSSVAFCLKHALQFKHIDHVVLATSSLEQDAALEEEKFAAEVVFFQGDPEDVMARYISACDELKLDVVVRVTADMPFIDNEICEFLLNEHFTSGADYTVGKDSAVGVNLEIFNVSVLKRIKSHFPSAELSEYMTWYFQNNPEHVKIHKVDLPEIFIRPYRLTLDYEEDLTMFNHIHSHFISQNKPDYNLRDVIAYLDQHPEIAAINGNLTLRYKTDQSLIDLLNEKTKIQ